MRKPYFAYRSFRKELEAKKDFAGIGVRQFCVFPGNTANGLGEPYSEYPSIWKWFDSYDFAPLDEQIQDVLKICPDAELLLIIDLNSPLWLARQLGARSIPSDSFPNLTGCLCEDVWCREVTKYMEKVIDYVRSKYDDHLSCVMLACGTTDEWLDYSTGTETAGRLKKFKEWSIRQGFPEPAEVPNDLRRFDAPHDGVFRDPQKNQDALRYWKFHSELVADGICGFASAARKKLRPDQEIGAFYGYVMELAYNRIVQNGHLAYEKLLDSGLIDFFMSPGCYEDRAMGGAGGFMNLNGTIHRHGKHYLHELDHRTHSGNMQLTEHVKLEWLGAWPDVKSDLAGLRREFCRTLAHGASLWWFDMWGGYYKDPAVLEAIGQMQEIWDELADRNTEPDSEIAIFVDPDSILYLNDHNVDVRYPEVFISLQTKINRIGAPCAMYDISDIPHLPKTFKLIILPFWIEVTPEKLKQLETAFPDARKLWYGPAGLTDGIRWEKQPLDGTFAHDFLDFTVEDLRREAISAGVHMFSDINLPIWATDHFLSCHSAESGVKEFRLKKTVKRIVERFSNKTIAVDTDIFTYPFDGPETALFVWE